MTSGFSLKIFMALVALFFLSNGPRLTVRSDSVAWLSFPAGEAQFQKTIDQLIKDYGKDDFVA